MRNDTTTNQNEPRRSSDVTVGKISFLGSFCLFYLFVRSIKDDDLKFYNRCKFKVTVIESAVLHAFIFVLLSVVKENRLQYPE